MVYTPVLYFCTTILLYYLLVITYFDWRSVEEILLYLIECEPECSDK